MYALMPGISNCLGMENSEENGVWQAVFPQDKKRKPDSVAVGLSGY